MKNIIPFVLILLISVVEIPDIFSQAGALDPTFDGDGIALFDLSGGYHESAWDMVTMADTTSLLVGTMNNGSFSVSEGFLLKLSPDGSQDVTWGTGGLVTFTYGNNTYAYNLLIQPDDKILVSGICYITASDAEFFLSRFNPDGSPDVSFGSNGVFLSSYTTDEDVCETMALQPDGKIVLAGRTYAGSFSQLLFMRVNPDGTLDTSFGSGGYTEINASPQDERINSLGILSSGTIVGFGYGYQSSPWFGEQVFMAKLHADGTPMTSFAPSGVKVPSVFTDISTANHLETRNDSLFVTGYQYDASNNWELFLTKMDSSGVADPSFATGGISLTYINPVNIGSDMLLTDDYKLYIAGTTGLGGPNARDFLVVRYLPDGTLDPAFNSTGYVTTTIRVDWDEAAGIGIQPDGKIVCTGMSGGLTSSGNNDVPVTRYLNDYIPSGLIADFSANPTLTCVNSPVSFTDQTFSTDSVVVSWEWAFEGGTPGTSSIQNPTVQYASDGVYDVQLIVYDGIYHDTLLKEDYISIETTPVQPGTPAGPAELCGSYSGQYTTNSVMYADEYDWMVTPDSAGTFTGTDTVTTFQAADDWTGTCMIKVRATGLCGDGAWSNELQVEIRHNPVLFQLSGTGPYCEGEPGTELTLDGSEMGVDYELYLDGTPTGNIAAGTGSSISFGYQSDEGLYEVLGYTDYCSEEMIGQVYVFMQPLPDQPSMPAGSDTTCNYSSETYAVGNVANADALIWSIDPDTAAQLFPAGLQVVVQWDSAFAGTAYLSVHGTNDCGDGPESEAFDIDVFAAHEPATSGPQLVCDNTEEIYETENVPGNLYTWEVTGGVVTAGAGTYQATILWGDPGAGTVVVIEQTPEGCVDTADVFEVTIDECTLLEEPTAGDIKIYPNPAHEYLFLDLSRTILQKDVLMKIVNSTGEIIISRKLERSVIHKVNTSQLSTGIYFIQLFTDNKRVISQKFLILN